MYLVTLGGIFLESWDCKQAEHAVKAESQWGQVKSPRYEVRKIGFLCQVWQSRGLCHRLSLCLFAHFEMKVSFLSLFHIEYVNMYGNAYERSRA